MSPAYLADVAAQSVVEGCFTAVDEKASMVAYLVLCKAVETVNGLIGPISPVAIKHEGCVVWLKGPDRVVSWLLAAFINEVGTSLDAAVVTEGDA